MSSLLIAPPNTVKLGTSFPLSKLKAVNAWDAPLVLRAPHSSGATSVASSTTTNRVERRNVGRDEACFITNDSSYVHQRAHWINAIRGKEEKDNQMRKNVVQLLFLQGIVSPDFTLDDSSNLTNLDSRLHSAMDKFAMFGVTCTHPTLDALIEIVHKENQVARERADQHAGYIRHLQFLGVSETAEYEVVVLQPKHFLPNKSYLTRYPTPNDPVETPKFCQVDANGVLREAPLTADSPRYPSFRFVSDRERGNKLNPYLVILAAEIKFRRYRAAPNAPQLDAQYEALIDKTTQLADLLYWEPVPGANARRFSTAPDEEMDVDDNGTAESQSELGFRVEVNDAGGSTARPRRGTSGRGGTRRPEADLRYLLSGRDLSLEPDDRELLHEMGLSNRVASINTAHLERVDAWRNGIAA